MNHNLADNQIDCSCKMFLKFGVLCSHAFYALNHADVEKIPPQYLLNRWMKNAERILIHEDCQLPQWNLREKKNTKLKDIWYDFNSCLSLAGLDDNSIEDVHSTIKNLKQKLLAEKGQNANISKKDIMASVFGSQPSDVIVQPPKLSRNKGCGKRLLSPIEISQKEKKKGRICKACGVKGNHDSRNCPGKK